MRIHHLIPASFVAALVIVALFPALYVRLNDLGASAYVDIRAQTLMPLYGLSLAALALVSFRSLPNFARFDLRVFLGFGALWLWLSAWLNHSAFRPMMVLGPLLSVALFYGLQPYARDATLKPAAIIIIAISIAPVALLLLGIDLDLYLSESFRGLATSRTDYTFYAGIAAILAITLFPRGAFMIVIAIGLGLAFSASRTSYISLSVALFVYVAFSWIQTRRWKSALTITAIALVTIVVSPSLLPQFVCRDVMALTTAANGAQIDDNGQADAGRRCVAVRADDVLNAGRDPRVLVQSAGFLDDSGSRLAIYQSALSAISSHWIFGNGDFYQTIEVEGIQIEPHNSLLQSALNFGWPVAVFWVLAAIGLFLRLSPSGKSLLTFWAAFGLFQPGFDAYLLSPESLLILCLAVLAPPTHQAVSGTLPSRKYFPPVVGDTAVPERSIRTV